MADSERSEGGNTDRRFFGSRWYYTLLFFAILVFFGGGYVALKWYSRNATGGELTRTVERAVEALQVLEDAMRSDTYGGRTPEQTLALFVGALEREDVEAAANYFMLESNPQSPDYLTRNEWRIYLAEVKQKNLMKQMASDIEKHAKSMEPSHEGDASFALYEEDGTVGVLIDMELNAYSGVWKIESL